MAVCQYASRVQAVEIRIDHTIVVCNVARTAAMVALLRAHLFEFRLVVKEIVRLSKLFE